MSHRVTYKPLGILLPFQRGEITIDVDGTSVDVCLTAPSNVTVLSERYYAYGGSVTLYDIGSLIENEMRKGGTAYGDFTLALLNTAGTVVDSCILHILYCDRYTVCTDTYTFLTENFLTTLQHRRVAPESTTSLYYFAKYGENISAHISVHCRCPGFSKDVVSYRANLQSKTSAETGVMQLDVSLPKLKSSIATYYSVKEYSVEILYYTVNIGQRAVTCYVDPSLDSVADAFAFRNIFNVWETAILPGVTKTKNEVERSTAVVCTRMQFYNQRVAQTYELETGPLTSDEAEWIDQLCTSHEVMRIEPNACDDQEPLILVPVLITDSDCTASDTDEKPVNVKFTWRFEDNRPIVRLSASPGIFTQNFNNPYC